MKNLYHKLSLFSVLALVAFEPQNLQATSNNPGAEEQQDSQKLQTSPALKLVQDTVQKIKNGQFISDEFLSNCFKTPKEIKQFGSTITPDHPMFNSWITLVLKTFPTNPAFIDVLKIAKTRGESDMATSIAQYNLGLMYDDGYGVDRNSRIAYVLYEKAADQGYAEAQYQFGRYITEFSNDMDIENDHQSYIKGFKYYENAAKQGHPLAQDFLAYMYRSGRGTDRDLAQSLKWYLESYKNNHPDPSNYPKNFVGFTLSSITPEDEKKLNEKQKTLEDDVNLLLRSHDVEKKVNDSASPYKECKWAIPSFFESYKKIVDFEEISANTINACHQPGFMINCLKVREQEVGTFKASRSTDIKYFEFQDQSFLTFGQKNIEIADNLMKVFNKTSPYSEAISNILSVLREIQQSFQIKSQTESLLSDEAQALKKQYESRLRLELENQSSKQTRTLMLNTQLPKKVEQEIEALTQLQAIPQRLQDLLIEGAPVRNRLFLQNNNYIEPILKD